ncbi:rna-directed dna polymerase from mobile element jockey- hypothetical protein [Limosa lapponica baueri]|uniref:Uncharacterized protein n=1 Tax=Limosa lapponica baueri TaxID=1758121 RepID=A0A2I0UQN1_LIMLA|nr:rna-directed dna polymerase from mobile element jockey- hypothetical protein [Limosa lapponica baueri]
MQVDTPTQLGVVCKFTEGARDPLIQIIDKDFKENRPQYRALWDTTRFSWWKSHTLEGRERVWRKEDSPLIGEDQVRDHLGKLDTYSYMGPDGVHPQVLKSHGEQERCLRDWRKANVIPIFKKGKKEDPENYRPVSLTSLPVKVMEQLTLDVISKHVEEKEVIRSGQHGFTKGKSCLTNLLAFRGGMTAWEDEGKAGSPGGQQIYHEPAMGPCGQEGQWSPGVH